MNLNFKKVGENIYKAQNALSKEDCKYVFDFMLDKANNPVDNPALVPWDDANNNVVYYPLIEDRRLLDIINAYKKEMNRTLEAMYNEPIFPHLTSIVLWKPGQSMGRHVDNGFGADEIRRENLKVRDYTSIAYMNDDFDGGETFIRSDGKTEPNFRTNAEYAFPNNSFSDFVSKPETGTTVIFKADDTNAHGVNKLLNGTRVILSTWFTNDPNLMHHEMLK
jgi:hypothetical protein